VKGDQIQDVDDNAIRDTPQPLQLLESVALRWTVNNVETEFRVDPDIINEINPNAEFSEQVERWLWRVRKHHSSYVIESG
jgi:hypothetical protein